MTIFTIAYNEELMLQNFIDHYRSRFPGCKIILYDNYSVDRTREIALQNGCEICMYDSGNQIRDDLYLKVKNNCWKWCVDDWVCVCDVDEICDIDESRLMADAKRGATIVKFKGWNMVNQSPDPDSINLNLDYGFKAPLYDKCFMFSPKYIKEINYTAGAHTCKPAGKVTYGSSYNCYHLKFIGKNYLVNRYKDYFSRLSDVNKQFGWGVHYSPEVLRQDFDKAQRIELTKLR